MSPLKADVFQAQPAGIFTCDLEGACTDIGCMDFTFSAFGCDCQRYGAATCAEIRNTPIGIHRDFPECSLDQQFRFRSRDQDIGIDLQWQ